MRKATHQKTSKRAAKPPSSEFSFGSGARYADNAEYAEKGLTFAILAIAYEAGRGYAGCDRWAVTVKSEGRDPEILSLAANPKRDEQLRAAQAHLERGGSIKNARLRRPGDAYYLTDVRTQ